MTLREAAQLALDAHIALREWINAVPQDTQLPSMPGIDGDWLDDVEHQLRQALAEPEQPMPPFESKRKAAMAIYTPPFRYEHGYIFDSQRHMVADNGPICDGPSVEGAVAARVRGWGRIVYMPNAKELQDEIGAMLADALNALYAKESEQPARVPLTRE